MIQNRIYQTTDYSQFKRLAGNRDVPDRRVSRIIESIQKNGYIQSPILVNEKMEVIDGQGRLEALKRLGLPVDFYISPGLTVKECRALNQYATKWTTKDFVLSCAEMGNQSYQYFAKLMQDYSWASIATILNALTGGTSHSSKKLANGEFTCTKGEYEQATKILAYDARFLPIYMGGKREYFFMAVNFCYNLPDVDNEKLYKRILSMRGKIVPASTIDMAIDNIEAIYNYRAHPRVYISTKWNEYKISRKSSYNNNKEEK